MFSKILIRFLLLPFALLGYSPGNIKVVQSDASSITFEYRSPSIDSSLINIDGNNFYRISIRDGYNFGAIPGNPEIQSVAIKIGTPEISGNTISLLSTEQKSFNGILQPVPEYNRGNATFVSNYSETVYEKYTDQPLLQLKNAGIIRSLNVVDAVITPVQYNHRDKQITVYTKIVFRVNFASAASNIRTIEDNTLRTLIVNYNVAKQWIKKSSRFEKVQTVSSVLSSGKWYKIPVTEEGIYKITRSHLAQYGIDAATVDPRKIRIFGNGGKPVPEPQSAVRISDLEELAILVSGEEDGVFNEDDFVLFYGRGVNFFEYDETALKVTRSSNPYAKENSYWITSGSVDGKRMSSESNSSAPDQVITQTKSYVFWDEDKFNIGKTGRIFAGDQFQENSKSKVYTKKLEGLLPSTRITYSYRFINSSSQSVVLQLSESDSVFYSRVISGYGSSGYSYGIADISTVSILKNLAEDRSQLKFTFNATSASTVGYLDYYEIAFDRSLKAINDQLMIFTPVSESSKVYEYNTSDFSNTDIKFFDVSDHANVKRIVSYEAPSGGSFSFRRSVAAGKAAKIIGICNTKYLTPAAGTEIKNQNLRGESNGAEFVIITPKEFRAQADRLANFRMNESTGKLSTLVVNADEIFNEFSGGLKDISAIRDYLRYGYDNWNIPLHYVLLFGDGDYDYRNIERGTTNWIIPYETSESLDEIYSYNSDDFYGRISGDDNLVDLAVGRIPVQNLEDATIAVSKLIAYEKESDKDLWRNLITLVSDDGYTSTAFEGDLHTRQSENIARYYIPAAFDVKKLYAAVYPTVFTSLGRRKPSLNQAILESINSGTLILNYIGHGSPELWGHEQFFVKDVTIPQMINRDYFFLTAATCDFAYFDKTSGRSAGEELMMKEGSGAIGVFASSRPVFSFQNAELAYKLFSRMLFSARDSLSLPIPVGLAYMYAKSTPPIDVQNDSKFHLLADPTLRLNIPRYNSSLDSINGMPQSATIQVKALSTLKITGSIRDANNNIWTGFNGEGLLTVYDSERNLPVSEFGTGYTVPVQGGIIFKGRVSIVNGNFSAAVTVPKDISYENKKGKISFYFQGESSDGLGFASNIIVGGSDSAASNDNNGPDVAIFFDVKGSEYAELVNPNSTLIVELKDETGINTTGLGVGHKLEGIINDDELNSIDLSQYYIGDIDSGGKNGEVRYKFSNLSSGDYKLEIKVWDVFNNPSEKVTYFSVIPGDQVELRNVWNYPNPFSSSTTFLFDHNQNQSVDVKINIYSIAGRLVNVLEKKNINDKYVKIDFDGRDKEGSLLANGTYLYKITVTSAASGKTQNVLGKLSIAR